MRARTVSRCLPWPVRTPSTSTATWLHCRAITTSINHFPSRPQPVSRLPPFHSVRYQSTDAAPAEVLLPGTAPAYTRHLVLHTPHPSTTWPSHLESVSALVRALNTEIPNGIGVGVAYDRKLGPAQGKTAWSADVNRFDAVEEEPEAEETYSATLYPDFLTIPSISLSTLPALIAKLSAMPPPSAPTSANTIKKAHVFVCTHATRDCRCGILGSPLYEDLVEEVARMKLGEEHGGAEEVKVQEIAHIGGHKYAANALVYREGGDCDWYGLLRSSDASRVLSLALHPSPTPWFPRWRGRLNLPPHEAKALAVQASQNGSAGVGGKRTELRGVLGDEPVPLRFVSWDEGDEWEVEGFVGESLMEVARRHDLPSILATCGGHCECATCHVILDEPLLPIPPLSEEEEEQLDFALGRTEGSRLACQIPVSKALGDWCGDGGTIKLPRY